MYVCMFIRRIRYSRVDISHHLAGTEFTHSTARWLAGWAYLHNLRCDGRFACWVGFEPAR